MWICPLYKPPPPPQGVCACVSQLSLAHLRCLFLSCRATANVQNVLQRQSGLKTERDGKRIDTPLAAATALGGCELYSYPASGEMKRELGRGVEVGGYKDGQAVSGDERSARSPTFRCG